MLTDLNTIEQILQALLTMLGPYATPGLIAAACLVALSRLPLLSIAAMAGGGACLAVIVSAGDGGVEVGMALLVAALVAGAILLLSGGVLWRRPSLRSLLPWTARPSPPLPSPLSPLPSQNLPFRLAAVVVIALAAEALAPVAPLRVPPQEARLALWLVGMGLLAAFSSGSAIVSGTGYIMALNAAALFVPDIVPDPALRPLVFGAIAALMIIASLGFSFADVLRKPRS